MTTNDVIYGINGPVVTVKGTRTFSMMEMVYVGESRLVGEIIGINDRFTTIQVYEETTGLKPGDAVYGTGAPMNVLLGPGVNIKRDPRCGRNFEYFSEDPFVAGQMGAAWVEGAQSTGIGTSLKHFAANNQEYKRFNGNSQMDERTLREIYLSAFETLVKKAQPSTVMCAYPMLNGVHCSDNKML